MNRVVVIAAVLGAEATRESLVPFLVSRVSDLDQVTLALSKKVGDLVPRIGGPEHTTCLIPLLELLCSVEETTVRVAITASISKILLYLSMPDHAIQINEYQGDGALRVPTYPVRIIIVFTSLLSAVAYGFLFAEGLSGDSEIMTPENSSQQKEAI
jgi:hypothetical protein